MNGESLVFAWFSKDEIEVGVPFVRRFYSAHSGDLNTSFAKWRDRVDSIDYPMGWSQGEYIDSIMARKAVQLALDGIGATTAERIGKVLAPLDERYRQHTVASQRPRSVDAQPDDWWFYHVPVVRAP